MNIRERNVFNKKGVRTKMKRMVSTEVMLMSIEELLENAEEFDAEEDAYRFLYSARNEYEQIKKDELKARQEWGIFS